MTVKVLVLAEYYPRAEDPARGIWAHRQTRAARDAGAEVRVIVLHRPVPPRASLRHGDLAAARREVSQPPSSELDGITIDYLRYISPPRPWSYTSWGAWAAPLLARRLRRLHREFPFELIHAHYAVPAGDAAHRAAPTTPLLVSVHGHDVFGAGSGGVTVARVLGHARLVLANSAETAARCLRVGATATRVVHLGTDLPPVPSPEPEAPILVTVAHLTPRKRHIDVIAAVGELRAVHPQIRYVIVGDGSERSALETEVARLELEPNVEFRGALPPEQAQAVARHATLFVMPSVDEAFGVAYVEAMAGGVPAIGCIGEGGPQEIAGTGGGIVLTPARNPQALANTIAHLLREHGVLRAMRADARANVEAAYTWSRCGRETVAAYAEVRG